LNALLSKARSTNSIEDLTTYENELTKKYSSTTIRWLRSKAYKLLIRILADLSINREIRDDLKLVNVWLQLGLRQGASNSLTRIEPSHSWTNNIFWLYKDPDLRLRHAYYDVFFENDFSENALNSVIIDMILYLWNMKLFRQRLRKYPILGISQEKEYRQILNEYLSALSFLGTKLKTEKVFSGVLIYYVPNILNITNRLGVFSIVDTFVPIYEKLTGAFMRLSVNPEVSHIGLLFALADLLNFISLSFKRAFNQINLNIAKWSSYIYDGIDIIGEYPELTVYYESLITHGFRWAVWHNDLKLANKLFQLLPQQVKYKQLDFSVKITRIWYNLIKGENLRIKDYEGLSEEGDLSEDLHLILELTRLILVFEYPEWELHPYVIGNRLYTWCLRKGQYRRLCTLIRKISYTYTNDSTRWKSLLQDLKELYKNSPIYMRIEQIVPLSSWLETKQNNLPVKNTFKFHYPLFDHKDLNYPSDLRRIPALERILKHLIHTHEQLNKI